jgi:predicted CopG family antitoxin
MKTITLTSEAYRRLKDWKAPHGDSFSKVVLRLVPERGTLGQMVSDVVQLPRLTEGDVRVMEEAAQWGREPEADADRWNSWPTPHS